MTDDQRKLTYLRDSVDQLQTDKSLLEQLLSTIQTASNEEAAEIFRRLRSGGELQPVAEEIQAGKLLSNVGGASLARHFTGDEQAGTSTRQRSSTTTDCTRSCTMSQDLERCRAPVSDHANCTPVQSHGHGDCHPVLTIMNVSSALSPYPILKAHQTSSTV